MMMMMMNTV